MTPKGQKARGKAAVTRNRRGVATRELILDAAFQLLRAEGFDALSLDRVARAARISRSSVYHQFHSRDGLMLELVSDSLRRLLAARRRRSRPPKSRLEGFLIDAESVLREGSELVRMFFRLVFDRNLNQGEMNRLLRNSYSNRTRNIVAGLVEDGATLPPEELETLAIVLEATIDGLLAWHLIHARGQKLKRALELLKEIVTDRIDGRAASPGVSRTPSRGASDGAARRVG